MSIRYWANLFRLLRGDRVLEPLVASYCVTPYCNLNCRYCEDFGARRNASAPTQPLPLAEAKRLLAIIRQATDSLIFTGGEPLLYSGLSLLAAHAQDLRFRSLTLLSNATLLPDHLDLLQYLTRLVISLDAVDAQSWDQTLRAEPGTAQTIINTIDGITQSKPKHLALIVHCVLAPETLPHARGVLEFCMARGILFACSPQSANNWPRYELMAAEDYAVFITHLIELKRQGAPILGSLPYLRSMLDWQPYPCYPFLMPRVMPDGSLAYPCRPIERGGTAHGGRVNLLECGSWAEALRRAMSQYGPPPLTCGSCYQQCYVEPSLMQAQPLALLRELISFPPSRRASIHTFAPG